MTRSSQTVGSPPHRDADPFRSEELRLLAALLLAVLGLAGLLLGLLGPRTGALLLDFETWRLSASPQAEAEELEHLLRPRITALRPLRLDLRLGEPAARGEVVAAEREYRVEPDAVYCFRVFVWSEPGRDDTRVALPRATVLVGGEPAASWVPRRSGRGALLRVDGIRPREGEIALRFEVQSGQRPARRKGGPPAVHFEFASLVPCDAEPPG